MKEQALSLSKFTSGLRPYANNPINQDTATECFNLAPRIQGLVPIETINQSIDSIVASFPFPQIFFGHKFWLACTSTKIYTINGDFSLTLELDLTGAFIGPGQVWHFADFFDYVILTNGIVTVYRDPDSATFKIWVADSTMPNLGTVMNFNGQIIASPISAWHDADKDFIIWSKIGSADFTVDQSNTAGYRPMPWTGEVYKIMKLGEMIAVYGSGGIEFFKFQGTSLGLVKKLDYGIASRDAVGGDENSQVFIDTAGYLRVVNAKLEISDGVYQEFFSTMLGRDIIVSFNPLNRDFYISDGVRGFIKTNQGLCETFQGVISVGVLAGTLIGFYVDLNESIGMLTTGSLDFGIRARKTIDVIEIGAESSGDIQVAVEYKNKKSDVFSTGSWVTVNDEGVVNIPTSGVEFRIKVKALLYSGFKLNYIIPRIKFDDKRSKRGTLNVSTITS